MRVNRSIFAKLCLLTAVAVPVQPAVAATLSQGTPRANASAQLLAQNTETPEFALPASLDGADSLRIDGSSSMRSMSTALADQFQERYPDAEVVSETSGSDSAIEQLLNGEIDLVAIGRPLTEAEAGEGLSAVAIARDKIAVIVGPENPFAGNITFEQFAQIFRGEITDWSELGGESGPIRFVDRPEESDTRRSFQAYPVFQAAPFATGATADAVSVDETDAVIETLGDDGIGYAIANQVMGSDEVSIISMHKTQPDNPAYPFSQPRNYVYLGDPSEPVQGFLAVAAGEEGQNAIAEVQDAEAAAAANIDGPLAEATSPDGEFVARTTEDNVAVIEDSAGNLVAGPLLGAGGAITALAFSEDSQTLATGTNTGNVRVWDLEGNPLGPAFPAIVGADNAVTDLRFDANDKLFVSGSNGRQGFWGLNGLPFGETDGSEAIVSQTDDNAAAGSVGSQSDSDTAEEPAGLSPWLWLIPLLGLLGAGLWLLLGKNRRSGSAEAVRQTSPTATVPPPVTDLAADREVSNRAHSVISTDRVTDDSRVVSPAPSASSPPPAVASGDAAAASASTDRPDLLAYESTDLEESPDLAGTNLDLIAGAAALGGAAVAGGAAISSLDADIETENEDLWADDLDLTLEEEADLQSPLVAAPPIETRSATETPSIETPLVETPSIETPSIETPLVETPSIETSLVETPLVEMRSAMGTPPVETPPIETRSTMETPNIDTLEPTRDTVIAETETILDIEPTRETIISNNTVIFKESAETAPRAVTVTGLADTAAASLAAGAIASAAASTVASKAAAETDAPDDTSAFASSLSSNTPNSMEKPSPLSLEVLATVDDDLPELPEGYGDSRIVLLPRDPKWAYAYWDVSNEHKESLRRQGGQRLMLRLYDVTDIDSATQAPHSMQQQDCHEMARSWYLEVPVSDRDYAVEVGYLTNDDRWLTLARSVPVRIPPIYPSDWARDKFVTVSWGESLAGRSFGDLGQPYSPAIADDTPGQDLPKIYDDLFAFTQSQDALRVAGSLYGSMQPAAPGALSHSGGPSIPQPEVPGARLSTSGTNVSGLNMSGIGSGVSTLPGRSRNFWLVADAELIVYGATEPDATLTIGDKVVPLEPDGTFRFQMAFPDGNIDYPIRAVAVDGEQTRSTHLHFERETPERNTNTKAEAKDEWF